MLNSECQREDSSACDFGARKLVEEAQMIDYELLLLSDIGNAELSQVCPPKREHMTLVIEHQRVCLAHGYLLYSQSELLEVCDGFWSSDHIAHVIYLDLLFGQSQLAHVCSPPHVQHAIWIDGTVVVTPTLDISNELALEVATSNKLRLCVTDVVAVPKTPGGAVSPGSHCAVDGEHHAVLKPTGDPSNWRADERTQDVRSQQLVQHVGVQTRTVDECEGTLVGIEQRRRTREGRTCTCMHQFQ